MLPRPLTGSGIPLLLAALITLATEPPVNAQSFHAIQGRNGQGYIDTLGKVAIPPIYRSVSAMYRGVVCAELTEPEQGQRHVLLDSNHRRVDYALLHPQRDYVLALDLLEIRKEGETVGLFNKLGGTVIPPGRYSQIDKRIAPQHFETRSDGKYGVLNAYGEVLAEAEYDRVYVYPSMLYLQKGSEAALVDHEGNALLPWETYDNPYPSKLTDLYDASLPAVQAGIRGPLYFIEETRASAYNPEVKVSDNGWLAVSSYLGDKRYKALKAGKWAHVFYKPDGTWAIPVIYDDVRAFSEGLAAVKKGKKWGYIDTLGNWAIAPTFPDEPFDFSEGLAGVKVDGKNGPQWHYIDKTGNVVLTTSMRSFSMGQSGHFKDGLLSGKYDTDVLNKVYYTIDKTGDVVRIHNDDGRKISAYNDGIYAMQRKDYAQAAAHFREAMRHGYGDAMHNLGYLYEMGYGVDRDAEEARYWYEKAYRNGSSNGMSLNNIGKMLWNKGESTPALGYLMRAADRGNASAAYTLAVAYGLGQNVAKDTVTYLHWLDVLQTRDSVLTNKAITYVSTGKDPYRSYLDDMIESLRVSNEAMKGMTDAFQAFNEKMEGATNDLESTVQLRDGIRAYLSENYADAHTAFQKAATAGNADAMFYLGELHETGLGVEKNLETATEWYRKAATKGHQQAQTKMNEKITD